MQQRMQIPKLKEKEGMIRVRRTISSLLQTQPFFGALALNMGLIEDAERDTIAADGVNIRFNPTWVKDHHADEIKLAIARVVLACALKHHTRRGDRSYARWQQASKMVTLPLLADIGLTPNVGYQDVNFSVEKMYEMLPEDSDSGDESSQESNDGQPQGNSGQSQGNGKSSLSNDPDGKGEVMDASPLDSGASVAQLEKNWDRAMHQALQMSVGQCNTPGRIAQIIRSSHWSVVDWEDELSTFVQQQGREDYTWVRPNYRYIHSGLYLPSLHSETMPPLILAIDSSGSMNEDMLDRVWTEIRAICDNTLPEKVSVIQCDMEINGWDVYDPLALPEKLEAKGRGGTDFLPVFDAIANSEDGEPACLLYFTDLVCYEYPKQHPAYPVMWIRVGDYDEATVPPFGTVIWAR